MACQDLREFLERLEISEELHRISVEVDPVLEMAEITDRMSKSPEGGKALLFERVKGSRFPAATNIFGSTRRVCAALEVDELALLTRRMAELLQQVTADDAHEAGAALAGNHEFARFRPVAVEKGACQEVVEQVTDLSAYPILKSWPGDGRPGCDGRFITLPLVFTSDPDTGITNCGMYLVQVISPELAGIRWRPESGGGEHLAKYRARGERMPVSIALGGAPATIFSALLPLPDAIDEMQFAGFLRGKPVGLVCSLTSGIMVPAHAEMVIEGYIDPVETCPGGEFGNHTGFYAPARELPAMRITCITRRHEPIFPATVVGPPPMEDCYMAKAAERLMLPFTQIGMPEIVDINLPLEGIFHGAAVVSIDKRFAGHARQVMAGLWARGWLRDARLLVLVDRDVDIHDISHTFWKVLNSVNWTRDLVVADEPGDKGRPESGFPFRGKLGIDATRKLPGEGTENGWPEEVRMDETIRDLVGKRWGYYGFQV